MKKRIDFCFIPVIVACLCSAGVHAHDATASLQVSPDGHFLTQPTGEPFFWLGENGWDLFQRPDREEVERYLADRASKGFNVILAVLGGVHRGPNRYGEEIFVQNDPNRPNPKYFENVDWIIARAAHHGIRMGVLPYWGGHVVTGSMFDPANARTYGQWLGRKYARQGVIWVLGGDSNPLWPKAIQGEFTADGRFVLDRNKSDFSIVDHRPVYDAMAEGIIAGDGGKPVITYHPSCCSFPGTPQPRTSLYFGDRHWLTMHMFQSSHYANPAERGAGPQVGFNFSFLGPFNYRIVADEYRAVPTRPVIDGEARFEDLGIDNDAPNVSTKGFWTGYDARNAAYQAVFAGAAGHTYGNHSIWQFYDPARNEADPPARLDLPWQKAIHRPVSGQLRYLKQLMLSRPYFSRIPDQSLIVGDAGEGTAHIGASRDKHGNYALIYVPHGQQVTVDLTKLSGDLIVGWWYDPRTGSATPIQGRIPRVGTKSFSPLSTGKEDDWVLVLDNQTKGFAAPGAQPTK